VATIGEIVAAVDTFLATPKRIVRPDVPPQWGPGFSPHEIQAKYPLEIEGELRGSQLMIVGFPRERELKFRVGILFPAMICRVDYTDEGHFNSLDGVLSGRVPIAVKGPHYHSWPLNRRFFRGVTVPPKLHDAVPYKEAARTFDSVLRWFCADTWIESLPASHRISLPPYELLV
jgi:hypothetical protein